MRSIRHIKPLLVVPLLAIAAFAFGMVYERAYAAESNINNSGESQLKIDTVTTNPTDISTPASDTTYSYVAQPGDSYTQMARKAAQTYGLKYNTKIGEAKIVYLETNMTIEAKSPELEIGQKVNIKESTINTWVEKAKTMDQATEDCWQQYVALVDFNTNSVGNPL